CADGTVFDPKLEEAFDIVLLDAPCSALGLLYRKPDIKIHAQKEGMAALVEIQRALLANASRYVKKGGILLYSTCTINPAENRDNALWFLQSHPQFSADDFSADIPANVQGSVRDGMLQLLPHTHGVDGFFIARFRRIE
ncbi:MAG: 16S rRNA (cytosine(967)-C(5))-methyltransferase, partial [Eubacteriales bacterium]